MSLLSVELIGNATPTLRSAPAGRRHPLADRAVDVAGVAGLELDPWQADVLIESLNVDRDRWAAREVGVVMPRQNGKGSILEVRQLAGLFTFHERLQVHSAHEFKTCYEHFRRVKELIEGCPVLADQVSIIRTGAGDQAIELKSGCRIRFIARSRSSGRGFSADTVYLDEAFKLDDATIGALLPAMSARPNPQIWYTSSAPHVDSTVLHRLRRRVLDGDGDRLFYVEWGNDVGVDPTDPAAWVRSNPAMGIRIAADDVEAEQRSMSPAEFARERLGVPDPEPSSTPGPIDIEVWVSLAQLSEIDTNPSVALAVTPDRRWATLAIAGRRADGHLHVEIRDHRAGTGWVIGRCVEAYEATRLPIRIHAQGPEASFVAELRERGVDVLEVSSNEYARATGAFVDAVGNRSVRHLGQPPLDRAVRSAQVRTSTAGAMTWDESDDVSILKAVTVAAGGVPEPKPVAVQPLGAWR